MCQLVTNYFPLLVRLWLDELFTINHKPFSLSIKLTNNHSLIRWYQVLSLSILTTLTILWRGYTPWSSIPWIAGSHLVRGFHPFPRKPGRFRPLDAKIKTSWTKESPSFWWDKNSHIPWNNDSSHEKHLGNEIPPFSNHSTSREIPEKKSPGIHGNPPFFPWFCLGFRAEKRPGFAAFSKVPLSGWAQMVAFAGTVELFQYVPRSKRAPLEKSVANMGKSLTRINSILYRK